MDLTIKQFAQIMGVKHSEADGFVRFMRHLGIVEVVGTLKKTPVEGKSMKGKTSKLYRFNQEMLDRLTTRLATDLNLADQLADTFVTTDLTEADATDATEADLEMQAEIEAELVNDDLVAEVG